MPPMASRNDGAEAPISSTALNNPAPGHFSVVATASSTASTSARSSEKSVSSRVAGRNVPMSVLTGRRVRYDVPRSPWNSPPT